MKLRWLLLILCLLFISEDVLSQVRRKSSRKKTTSSRGYKPKEAKGTVIGIRAGGTAASVNINENSFDYPAEYETYPGLMGGLVISIAKNDTFFIQPEILFVQKGYHVTGLYRDSTGAPISDSYLKLRSNYLEVPVLFKLALGSKNRKLFVNAGPYVGYWISGSVEGRRFSDFDSTYTFTTSSPIGTNLPIDNRTELGGVIGAGAEFVTPGGTFSLELRYTAAFSDRFKYNSSRPEEADKVRNRYLSLSLAYILRN